MSAHRRADPPPSWQHSSRSAFAEELPDEAPRRVFTANSKSKYKPRPGLAHEEILSPALPTRAVGPSYAARAPAYEEVKEEDTFEPLPYLHSSSADIESSGRRSGIVRTSRPSAPGAVRVTARTANASLQNQAPSYHNDDDDDDESYADGMEPTSSVARSARSGRPAGFQSAHSNHLSLQTGPYNSGAPVSAIVVKAEGHDNMDGSFGVFTGAGSTAGSTEEATLKRTDRKVVVLIVILTFVLLLAVIIGVVVGIVLSRDEPTTPSASTPSTTPLETSPPTQSIPVTPAPSSDDTTQAPSAQPSSVHGTSDLVGLVSAIIPSLDLTPYQDPSSPQGRAIAWIESDTFSEDNSRRLQRFTLATLWYAMGGANWTEATNWMSGLDECNDGWNDIFCSSSDEVVALYLFNNSLVGTLPPEVALLTSLTNLDLMHADPGGRLGGPIPTEIGLMTALKDAYLAFMSFTGTIPTEIGLLTNLDTFWGFQNRFSDATIPTEIGAATSLTDLRLFRNNLRSTVPTEIVNLRNLRSLIISTNFLTGTLPSGMSQLTKLTNINVWGNPLTGAMPDLTGMTALTSLLVWDTDIVGVVPSALCPNLDDVRVECENFVCTCCLDEDENECPSDLVVSAIGNGGISTAPLSNPSSPQSRALQWLRSDTYSSAVTLERKVQRYSLAAIFYATGGETDWFASVSDDFLQPSDECDWTSWVTCSNGKDVDRLDLWLNGMNGTMPDDIGLMTALTELDWHWNYITGTVPTTVGLLTKLTYLTVADNAMTGRLPTELGLLTMLTLLRANENQLSPPIPTELGLLVEMNDLRIGINNMSLATIPSELGLMKNITSIDLSELELVGTFPTELETLTTLTSLRLFDNFLTGPLPNLLSWPDIGFLGFEDAGSLTGTIPTTISQLTKLTLLALGGMDIEGTIPTETARLTNLQRVSFSGNSFSQPTIPTEFGKLSDLLGLWINEAGLVGSLPSELGRLTGLTLLSVADTPNQLVGTIPDEYAALTDLESIGVRNNKLVGPIPTFIGLWTNLDFFYLPGNDFTGGIPSQIGLLTKLTTVILGENSNLGGSVPSEIGLLTRLDDLRLSETGLTGQLPTELSRLTRLTWLSLAPNEISGPLPDLSGMTDLERLFLYNTDVTGTVPDAVCPGLEYGRVDCEDVSCTCCTDRVGTPCLAS